MPGLFDQRTNAMNNGGDVRVQLTELKSVVDKLRNMKPTDPALQQASDVLGACCSKIDNIIKQPDATVGETPDERYVSSPSSRGG